MRCVVERCEASLAGCVGLAADCFFYTPPKQTSFCLEGLTGLYILYRFIIVCLASKNLPYNYEKKLSTSATQLPNMFP